MLRNKEVPEELVDSLRLALASEDVEQSWNQWIALRGPLIQQKGNISLEADLLRLSEVLSKSDGNETKMTSLLLDVLRLEERRFSVAEIFSNLVQEKRYDLVFGLVSKALYDPIMTERAPSGATWQVTSQLLALAAVSAAAKCPEEASVQMCSLTRTLAPKSCAGRGSDSVDGFTLSLSIAKQVMVKLSSNSTVQMQALTALRQCMVTSSLDYQDSTGQYPISVLGRIASAVGRRDWNQVRNIVEIAQEANGSTLKIAAGTEDGADWNDKAWATLLTSALANKQTDLATKVWSFYMAVKDPRKVPSPLIWNSLLTGYTRCKDWQSMQNTWEQMQSYGVIQDWHTYTTLINGLFRAKEPEQALLLFEEIQHNTISTGGTVPIEVYNTLLLGLCFNRRLEDADKIMKTLIDRKTRGLPDVNIVTINTMLRGYGRFGDMDGMTSMLKVMGNYGLQADKITFTTVLDAMSRSGETAVVGKVYEAMLAEGIMPGEVTLTAMIKGYFGGADDGENATNTDSSKSLERATPRIDLALQLLDFMEKRGPAPNEITYTAVMSGLFAQPEQVRKQLQEAQLPSVYSTPQDDQKTDRHTLFSRKDWSTRPEAAISLSLYRRIQQRGLEPNRKTYHTLLSGLLANIPIRQSSDEILQDVDRALVLLNDMMQSVSNPNWQTWTILLEKITALCQNANPHTVQRALLMRLADVCRMVAQNQVDLSGSVRRAYDDARHCLSRTSN